MEAITSADDSVWMTQISF